MQLSLASIFVLAINAVFAQNICLVQFFGVTTFLNSSRNVKTTIKLGVATVSVMTLSTLVCSLVYNLALVPLALTELSVLLFAVLIFAISCVLELVLKKFSSALFKAFGVYLSLTITNSAVLAVCLVNVTENYSILFSVLSGIFCSVGFTFALWLFSCIRERLELSDIPESFKGMPILLVTMALLSMAFLGFLGISVK